jgi:plastocyanin
MLTFKMTRRLRGAGILLAAMLALALLSPVSAAFAQGSEVKVTIDNFTFSPAELTIKPGTVVVFENHDDIPHSIVDAAHAFKSPVLDTNERFSMTFTNAGEVAYFCGLHPHMTGKIIVAP